MKRNTAHLRRIPGQVVKVQPGHRWTIDDLLEYAGWTENFDASKRRNAAVALEWFQANVPGGFLNSPVRGSRTTYNEVASPSPFLRGGTGPALELMKLMQAIDFTDPVDPEYTVRAGNQVVRFRERDESPRQKGRYYTFLSTKQEKVALPADQTVAARFQATRTFTCLKSTVSDAYVDWEHFDGRVRTPAYRKGGRTQLYIPNPDALLKPM
ncbi:MAG: hypothetical protein KDA21_13490 [Phycisphaerales bacterium]|nr:hypothetical protein [Phycisphaerales bacterium]